MNIDRDLVNRALEKAGQEPLVEDDITKNTARWRLVKSFYLPTILETLSHTSWTSRKKRAKLVLFEGDNYSDYAYAYRLPLDCAKPEELLNNDEFLTEGNILYTDAQDAVLLYISNGYARERYQLPDEQPTSENFSEQTYYTPKKKEALEEYNGVNIPGEYAHVYKLPADCVEALSLENEADYIIEGKYLYTNTAAAKLIYISTDYNIARGYEAGTTYYIFSTDDYPAYEPIEFDPMLSQYIETRLASKIVLKITGNTELYQLLYNEALILEQKATNTSYAHNRSKAKGNLFWAEQLGLME